jgi:hypothetical protein
MAHKKELSAQEYIEFTADPTPPVDESPVGLSRREWKPVLTRYGVDLGGFNDATKSDHLESCLTSSFGLYDLVKDIEAPYPKALAELPTPETIPPTAPTDLLEFNAAKPILLDQYNNLKPDRPAPMGEALADRVPQYADFADLKPATRTAMKGTLNRFISYLEYDVKRTEKGQRWTPWIPPHSRHTAMRWTMTPR